MNRFKKFIVLLILGYSLPLSLKANDDWLITATRKNDSLTVCLISNDSKQQLAVLMQGLQVNLPSQHISVMFPSAPMVRNKMKHHPNEVKAMMRKDNANVEVKPDLLPLITALCDTTAIVTDSIGHTKSTTRTFDINLDKVNTKISFSFSVPVVNLDSDTMDIQVMSTPGAFSTRKEFTGKRLSKEKSPTRNGLGEASMGKDDKNRTIIFTQPVAIETEIKTQ